MQQWIKNKRFWKIINFDNNVAFIKTFKSLMNNDKSIFYKEINSKEVKLNARTQYYFLNCINDDDQELVSEQTIVRRI